MGFHVAVHVCISIAITSDSKPSRVEGGGWWGRQSRQWGTTLDNEQRQDDETDSKWVRERVKKNQHKIFSAGFAATANFQFSPSNSRCYANFSVSFGRQQNNAHNACDMNWREFSSISRFAHALCKMHEKLQNEISNSKSNRMEKHEHVFVIIQLLCASQGNKRREWKQKQQRKWLAICEKLFYSSNEKYTISMEYRESTEIEWRAGWKEKNRNIK